MTDHLKLLGFTEEEIRAAYHARTIRDLKACITGRSPRPLRPREMDQPPNFPPLQPWKPSKYR